MNSFLRTLILLLLVVRSSFAQQFICDPTPSTANTIPFGSAASSGFRQWIYYPSDFPGITSGNITDIYFKASAAVSPSFANLTIKIGFTTLNTFPNTNYVTGLQTVYNGAYSGTAISGNFVKVTLQTPFAYNNTQNIIIEVSQTGYAPGFSIMQGTSGFTDRSIFGSTTATAGSLQARLGSIGLDISSSYPPDASVISILSPNGVFCPGLQTVKAVIQNNSNSSVSNIPVQWTINGVAQNPYIYTGTLQPLNNPSGGFIDTVTLGLGNFPMGVNALKIWTNVANDDDRLNDTMQISVAPSTFTLTPLKDTICLGLSTNVMLTPTSGYSASIAEWQESNDGVTFTNISTSPTFNYNTGSLNATKYYRVQIGSGAGCYSNVAAVQVNNSSIQVDLGPDTIMCELAGTFELNAGNPGSTYVWQDNSNLQTFEVHTPGEYFVTVTNPEGCTASDTFRFDWTPAPSATFYANRWSGMGNMATFTLSARFDNVSDFYWELGDGSPNVTLNPLNHTYPNSGSYTIKLHIFNECGEEQVLTETINAFVGITDIAQNNIIDVYPNPATYILNIMAKNNEQIEEIQVIDAVGKVIKQQLFKNSNIKLDISEISSGVYTMVIKTPSGIVQEKIIKY
jgi:hypothetical protein